MKRYGLIGYPLGHSFSSKYFSEKFHREGITDCRYDLFPIESIQSLPALLNQYPDLRGLNVTIPYKKDILQYLTDKSNLPAGISACNCVKIVGSNLVGYNTDVTGFLLSLRPLLQTNHQKALILGNGGATVAVKYALEQSGISYNVVSRNKKGADLQYSDLNADIISSHHLIINTTPLGTHPHPELFPEIPYEQLSDQHLLYDLVYNPTVTTFMQKGAARGAVVKNGYDMLVIQAEESWKIWQGQV
jgi:shikimate dehydrogenase